MEYPESDLALERKEWHETWKLLADKMEDELPSNEEAILRDDKYKTDRIKCERRLGDQVNDEVHRIVSDVKAERPPFDKIKVDALLVDRDRTEAYRIDKEKDEEPKKADRFAEMKIASKANDLYEIGSEADQDWLKVKRLLWLRWL